MLWSFKLCIFLGQITFCGIVGGHFNMNMIP